MKAGRRIASRVVGGALAAGAVWLVMGAAPAGAEPSAGATNAPWAPPGVEIPQFSVPVPISLPPTETPPLETPPLETPPLETPPVETPAPGAVPPAPAAAGVGRRVVYSNSRQRVWLYERDGSLVHSYLVSGRRGVPRPGVYAVFSKSRVSHSAKGARLEHMVRFARGSRLAIGFHAIPVGRRGPIQSTRELGQFRSLGCVRQAPGDAARLWDFAPLGTRVEVTA